MFEKLGRATRDAWNELITPPEGLLQDMVGATLVGVAMFAASAAVASLGVGWLELPGFVSAASAALFVVCFTSFTDWLQPVAHAFMSGLQDAPKRDDLTLAQAPGKAHAPAPDIASVSPAQQQQAVETQIASAQISDASPETIVHDSQRHTSLSTNPAPARHK